MVLIDSNVFIAAFRKEEQDHKKAVEILSNAEEVVALDYVLAEVGTILLLREGKIEMKKAMEFLTKNKNISISQLAGPELMAAIESFSKQKGALSFVDIALSVVAEGREMELVTFDKELAKFVK